MGQTDKKNTGGPRYSRTFYLRIRLFTLEKMVMTIFQSKINFLSANSRFEVQNEGTYLPPITRETCIIFLIFMNNIQYNILFQPILLLFRNVLE
jgi:hypothetical protein